MNMFVRILNHTILLRGQTVHSVPCKWIPQQAKIRFVAKSATLLLFFDLLCCFGFQKQILKTLYCSELIQNMQICGIRGCFWANPEQFVEPTNKY